MDPDHDISADHENVPDSSPRSQLSPSHSHHSLDSTSRIVIREEQPLECDANESEADESEASAAVASLPKVKSELKQPTRESLAMRSRQLMENTPWVYSVSAIHVRMLRIPVSESAAIRELRVYATVDKRVAQTRGSKWKQSAYVTGENSVGKQKRRGKLSVVDPHRRNGFIEEAKWVRGDGKLEWIFPMEKFRRLKAYAPRIKAFVYALGEAGTIDHSSQSLMHQEKDGAILSFGWFFLDLRTPDLSERWLKLQNSPFGGEILISSSISPVQLSPAIQPDESMAGSKQAKNETTTGNEVKTVPTVICSESGDYLQIGDGHDVFVLSIFIQTALNLAEMVATSMGQTQQELEQTGYWLSYSFFDVVVQTDVFYDLNVAEFPAIRDSFRVQSCLKDLAIYIEALGNLTVFMCTENRVLGGVEIPLRKLLSQDLFQKSFKHGNGLKPSEKAEIEGNFSFLDFNNGFISASVAVEIVEFTNSKVDNADKAAITADTQDQHIADTNPSPTSTQVLFQLDHVRLKTSALTAFSKEKNLRIEIEIGEDKVVGDLVLSFFTKQHAYVTNLSLKVVVENISDPIASSVPMSIRCFSSVSNQLVATSGEAANVVQDEQGFPKSIVLSLLNESKQSVGQCTLICTHGLDLLHSKPALELPNDASNEKKHHYRISLKLQSVRDVDMPGGYSLRYQNPFHPSASVRSEWFTVQNKGEVDALDFYCVFELRMNPHELKQEMEKSVTIELISSDDESVGIATFSLNYLYFSEEHLCCSEDHCDEILMTETEAQTHWLDVHPASPEAQVHSYRSCSISIPIVHADSASDDTKQQLPRIGFVRVSAGLEDIGLLSQVTTQELNFLLPPVPYDKSKRKELAGRDLLIESSVEREEREQSKSVSVVREAEETKCCKPAAETPSITKANDATIPGMLEEARVDRTREQREKVVQLTEAFEREKALWKQEQHLQQLQWKRRFAEMEKARMDELEEEWARREEERSTLLQSAQEEYQRLEQTVRKSLADFEVRERRLVVAEAALKREQEAKRDETNSLQRRLKSEQHHTLSLAKKQIEAYERRLTLLETQSTEAERRAKQVESDFAEYRQQQRKFPEFKLREEIAALKGNVAELEKQKLMKERECEMAEANVTKMKTQVQQLNTLLVQEKKKHEAQVVDELEKLRVKYIAREEKYVLDGDRDELRAIKKQLDHLKGFKLRGSQQEKSSNKQQSQVSVHCRQTRSRKAELAPHTRSIKRPFQQSGLISTCDAVSDDGSDFEASSSLVVDHAKLLSSSLQSSQYWLEELNTPIKADEGDDSSNTTDSCAGSPDTELGRLVRERKVLLASGSYDTHSHVIRELDRLISVSKADTKRQKPGSPTR